MQQGLLIALVPSLIAGITSVFVVVRQNAWNERRDQRIKEESLSAALIASSEAKDARLGHREQELYDNLEHLYQESKAENVALLKRFEHLQAEMDSLRDQVRTLQHNLDIAAETAKIAIISKEAHEDARLRAEQKVVFYQKENDDLREALRDCRDKLPMQPG